MAALAEIFATVAADPPAAGPALASPVWAEVNRHGRVTFFAHAADLGPALWDRLFVALDWKDFRYYQTLEETLTAQGFDQGYLLLTDPDGEPRAIQPVFVVRQDLTVSLPTPLRGMVNQVRRWWPGFAHTGMLMSGCVVGEWDCGAGENPDWATLCPALDSALDAAARRDGLGLILWKDVSSGQRRALAPLRRKTGVNDGGGYVRFPSPPGVRMELDPAGYDEFVATRLGRSTRKSLRRKFRELAARTAGAPVTLEVKQALTADEADELHRLYETVARRGETQFEVFPPEYFHLLSHRMPEHAHSFVWRWRGTVVAFAFCMVTEDTLSDNDLGLDYRHAHDLHLYHLTFRDLYNWAVARGLRFYESAPLNYSPKLHLRMDLAPRDIYARHRWRPVQAVLRHVAPWLAPTRQEPLLRQFANAAEVTDPR